MSRERFTLLYMTLTRCIFTVLTGEAAVLLITASVPPHDFASAMLKANLPLCIEHLTAGIILYLLMASCTTILMRST